MTGIAMEQAWCESCGRAATVLLPDGSTFCARCNPGPDDEGLALEDAWTDEDYQ